MSKTTEHKATMYRQGKGWIVSSWNPCCEMFELSGELPYAVALRIVGEENRK